MQEEHPDRGEARPPAVLAGSSHLTCFGVPLRSPDGGMALMPVPDSGGDFLYLNGPFPREEAYWVEVERLAERHRLFISWRGSQHMAEFLLAPETPLDFVLSEQPDLPLIDDATIVPELMIVEKFAPSLDRLEALLGNVDRTRHGIVLCGAPPPKESVAIIRASLAREDYFVERLAALNTSPDTVAITPTIVLYKMWRLIQRMMRDTADRYGVRYAAVPAQAFSPTGFLHEAYWSADVTHANRDFGKLLLTSYRSLS